MSYPTILLDSPIEVQAPVNISTIEVLNVAENLRDRTVQAFVNYGVDTTWVSILNPDNYRSDWSDQDVSSAIRNWANTNFPQAK